MYLIEYGYCSFEVVNSNGNSWFSVHILRKSGYFTALVKIAPDTGGLNQGALLVAAVSTVAAVAVGAAAYFFWKSPRTDLEGPTRWVSRQPILPIFFCHVIY
jgi:hypothetical protein